jgi:hypothetical protein
MPLIAAAQDWLTFIIPIVLFIVWVLNQVIGRLAQPQNPPVRRPVAQPQQPPRPQPDKVDEEIEAFLRRAAQTRGQQPRPAKPARPAPSAPPRTLVPRGEPVSTARRGANDLVQVEMVDEEEEGPAGSRGISVSEHVQRHLDTREFQQRASTITKVDQADEQLEQRLHQHFDHRVGTLGGPTDAKQIAAAASAAATATKITAGGVYAMLKDPNSLRNAIILQEILRRPEI